MPFWRKSETKRPTYAEACQAFIAAINTAASEAQKAHCDPRQLAQFLEDAARDLRTQWALTAPIY
jgi:hypothetical protein